MAISDSGLKIFEPIRKGIESFTAGKLEGTPEIKRLV
jgi:hypothetical protein